MQAIILAGGFGTRLREAVDDVPKPMAPVANRPFLGWLLDYIQGQGVTRVMLSLHHGYEQIHAHFGHVYRGMAIDYCIEPEPLGTGGALRMALSRLDPEGPVFALNGDSFVMADYRRMFALHKQTNARLSMAVCEAEDCSRYSRLWVEAGRVTHFDIVGDKEPGLISAGLYVLSPQIFEGVAVAEAFSFEREFLNPLVPVLKPAAYEGVDYFLDIGTPADYARAQREIPALKVAEFVE